MSVYRTIGPLVGIIVQCVTEIDHVLPVGHCDLYFRVTFYASNIGKAGLRRAMLSCNSSCSICYVL